MTALFTTPQTPHQGVSRRHFLGMLASGALLAASPTKSAQAAFSRFAYKKLSLEHHHTGESLEVVYYERGQYIKDALSEISHFLRDYHNNQTHFFDPALLDQLHDLKLLLGTQKPFHVVSGYRSPSTNAELRRHTAGVAKHSLHMEGKAVDIRVDGIGVRTIRDAALSLKRGGVGFYPGENFVHLDTGDIRTWHR
jgi:uncharacterized protein YcbK (DUF882 family)